MTFDIEVQVSSISKVFCQLRYRSKYFDIEGWVFDIEATFDIEGFDIEATFDIGGGKVPDEVPDVPYKNTQKKYVLCTY